MDNILIKPAVSERGDGSSLLFQKAQLFIRLRWLAILVCLGGSLLATRTFEILPESNFFPLSVTFIALGVFNFFFLTLLHRRTVSFQTQMLIQAGIDLVVITVALHFSGGVENPLFMLYFLHLIIAAILLKPNVAYGLAGFTCVLFTGMVFGEYFGILPHYEIANYGVENVVASFKNEVSNHKQLFFTTGISGAFTIISMLIVYFTTSTVRQMRESESEALQNARELSSEKKKLEKVLEGSGLGFMLFDKKMRLKWHNDRVTDWFPDETFEIGEPCSFVHGEKIQEIIRSGSLAGLSDLSRESGEFEGFYISPSDPDEKEDPHHIERQKQYIPEEREAEYYEFKTYPIYDRDGNLEQVVELINNITEKRKLEQQARHEERMATLGRMASGISHELGNPLSSISARLRRLKQKAEGEFVRETAEFIDTQIGRMNRLIRDISSFARAPQPEKKPCQISSLVEETINLISLDPRSKNIEIKTDIDPSLSPLLASRDQLSQVFLNLGINALDALENNGEGMLKISAKEEEGELRIKFKDTGKGIPEEIQHRIFTPYFTTKESGEGTGIGLSISHSLVEAHNGSISVESEPGKGTTFQIRIPYIKPENRNEKKEALKDSSRVTSETGPEQKQPG